MNKIVIGLQFEGLDKFPCFGIRFTYPILHSRGKTPVLNKQFNISQNL